MHHVPETFHAGIFLTNEDGVTTAILDGDGFGVAMGDILGSGLGAALVDRDGFSVEDTEGNVLWTVDTEGSVHNIPETFNAGIIVPQQFGGEDTGTMIIDNVGVSFEDPDGRETSSLTDFGLKVNMFDFLGDRQGAVSVDNDGIRVEDENGNPKFLVNTERSEHYVPEIFYAGIEVKDGSATVWSVDSEKSVHNVPEEFNAGIEVKDGSGSTVWSVDSEQSVHNIPEVFNAGIDLTNGGGVTTAFLDGDGLGVEMVNGVALVNLSGFSIENFQGNVLWSVDDEESVHNIPEVFNAGIEVNLPNGGKVIIGEDDGLQGVFLKDPIDGSLRAAIKFVGPETFLSSDNVSTTNVSAFGLFGELVSATDGDFFGNVSVGGDLTVTGKITAGSIDPLFMESFLVSSEESYESGDVLVIDPSGNGVRLSYEAYDTGVIGVVAPDATVDGNGEILAVIMGAHGPIAEDGSRLVGYVKADASYGAIQAGDLLTTSETPGHAMVASDPKIGTILGKALEPLAEGQGLIRVFITLQ